MSRTIKLNRAVHELELSRIRTDKKVHNKHGSNFELKSIYIKSSFKLNHFDSFSTLATFSNPTKSEHLILFCPKQHIEHVNWTEKCNYKNEGKGREHNTWSSESSSKYSGGQMSGLVDNPWPNFTKVGPKFVNMVFNSVARAFLFLSSVPFFCSKNSFNPNEPKALIISTALCTT